MKPLFIPLKAEYFDAFRDRTKNTEYRQYGPRWNERTCTPGRPVVLSKGYGRRERLTGTIATFLSLPINTLTDPARAAFERCYGPSTGCGPDAGLVAAIQISVDKGAI